MFQNRPCFCEFSCAIDQHETSGVEAQAVWKNPGYPLTTVSARNACACQFLSQQSLVAPVVNGCGRVVGGHTIPSVAVVQHHAFQVPSGHMGGHTRVQQPLGCDAPLREFAEMDRIDLGHPDIDAPIAVAAHHMGAHARLNLQDGPQNVWIYAMPLGGWQQALISRQVGGVLVWGLCFGVGCGMCPGQHAQAKGQAVMTVKWQQGGCRSRVDRARKIAGHANRQHENVLVGCIGSATATLNAKPARGRGLSKPLYSCMTEASGRWTGFS